MRYREVIRMPLWLLALIYFFMLSFVLSIWAALGNTPALVALVLTSALLILIAIKTALVIEVDENELRVGRARIELKYCGHVHALTNKKMADLRTRDADPAAFLALRFWSSAGARIDIKDERDSTPYWLITSKNAEMLVKVLESN